MIEVMNVRSMAMGGAFGGKDIPEYYRLVKVLFTPEEAEINNAMPAKTFSAVQLAEVMGRDAVELEKTLKQMADKGLCSTYLKGELRLFRAAPFVPGILEFVFMDGSTTERDKKLARLVLEFKQAWEAESPMVIPYPMQRVITVDESIESGHTIHTYDQVKTYIDANEDIAAASCYCRHAAMLRGEDTHGMPMQVCLSFGKTAQYMIESRAARKLTQDESYKLLEECRDAGLVHMTHNTTDNVGYLCNCDQWHCYAIKMILKQPKPSAVFNSGFEPKFDADRCTACETCFDRCPIEAISLNPEDVAEVNRDRCIGCGLCTVVCPVEALNMISRPEKEIQEPPEENPFMKAPHLFEEEMN